MKFFRSWRTHLAWDFASRLCLFLFHILKAKKAFEAWSSSKEGVIKTEVKKKKEIKDKELEVKREKIMKKQDAKKYFESWKSKKDEILKETYKEKKEKEREKKQKKIEDHKEKIDIATRAFDKWYKHKAYCYFRTMFHGGI